MISHFGRQGRTGRRRSLLAVWLSLLASTAVVWKCEDTTSRSTCSSYGFLALVEASSLTSSTNSENTNPQPTLSDSQQPQQSPLLTSRAEAAADSVKNAMNMFSEEFRKYATLAGRPKPVLRSILFRSHSKQDLSELMQSLRTAIHWQDLLLLVALGWGTVPLLQLPYDAAAKSPAVAWWQGGSGKSGSQVDGSAKNLNEQQRIPYRRTIYYHIADHLQQVAKIAVAVYLVDVVKLLCIGMGWNVAKFAQLPHAFCQSVYAVWMANRGAAIKRMLLRRYINRHPETFGRIKIVNRLADACIYGLTVAIVLSILQVHMGLALQSFVALGSVGTLALGLASKGIAQEVIHGLLLASSDRLYEGDDVQFGNGEVSGTIVQLGWMETVLRRGDEVMVSIPNSHLMSQRVSNLSRVRRSQVKQVLRVSLDDAEKIPTLIDNVKREIRAACPELITDGSRPFRVYWTAINPDHCEVTIDTRFNIKPKDDVYLTNQQNALAAIHRAVKQTNVTLARPQPTPYFENR